MLSLTCPFFFFFLMNLSWKSELFHTWSQMSNSPRPQVFFPLAAVQQFVFDESERFDVIIVIYHFHLLK